MRCWAWWPSIQCTHMYVGRRRERERERYANCGQNRWCDRVLWASIHTYNNHNNRMHSIIFGFSAICNVPLLKIAFWQWIYIRIRKKNSSIYSYEVCNNIIISIIIIWSLVICGQDKKQDNITVQLYICVYYMPESHTYGHGHKVFSVKNKQILDMLCHTHTLAGTDTDTGFELELINQYS